MGGANLSDDQPWVTDYVEKMMKDRKYVEDSYNRIQTQKIFEWAAAQVKPTDKDISCRRFYEDGGRASAFASLAPVSIRGKLRLKISSLSASLMRGFFIVYAKSSTGLVINVSNFAVTAFGRIFDALNQFSYK